MIETTSYVRQCLESKGKLSMVDGPRGALDIAFVFSVLSR